MFFTTFFTTITNAVRARNSYHDTVWELNRLTDKELSDIGISRSDIYRVAAESAFARLENAEDRSFKRTLVAKEA